MLNEAPKKVIKAAAMIAWMRVTFKFQASLSFIICFGQISCQSVAEALEALEVNSPTFRGSSFYDNLETQLFSK